MPSIQNQHITPTALHNSQILYIFFVLDGRSTDSKAFLNPHFRADVTEVHCGFENETYLLSVSALHLGESSSNDLVNFTT